LRFVIRWLPFIVVFISASGAGMFSYLLYADVYMRHEVLGDREIAGEISEIENSVKRKLSDRFVFDSVEPDDRVYWNDTIQTTNGSKVKILLSDGTKIALGESALIVLEKDQGGLSLKLKSGNLIIEGETNNGALTVNGVKVEKDANKSITLNVDKAGELTATQTDKNGEQEKLDLEIARKKEEERALAEAKAREEAERSKELFAPELVFPKAEGKIDLSSDTKTWAWNPSDGAVEYRFVLSVSSKAGTHVVYERSVKGTKFRVVDQEFEDGAYIWSLYGIDRFGRATPVSSMKVEIIHSDSLDAPEIETSEVQ
jgi:hypothetical protein